MTRKFRFTAILLACLFSGLLLQAATEKKSTENPAQSPQAGSNRSASPLGAGISLVITFGLAFGVRRLMDRRIPTDDIT